MTIERQRSRILCCSLGFSFSRTEIFSTETESDWISVEKPGGVLEVLEAAGGKLRVAQGTLRGVLLSALVPCGFAYLPEGSSCFGSIFPRPCWCKTSWPQARPLLISLLT